MESLKIFFILICFLKLSASDNWNFTQSLDDGDNETTSGVWRIESINEGPEISTTEESSFQIPTNECSIFEFKCNDGECIDLSEKCNDRYDCRGGEDELNCDEE